MVLQPLGNIKQPAIAGEAKIKINSIVSKMAPKTMETLARKICKGVIILEVAGVFGAYALFQKMNSSRNFRRTMDYYLPQLLEVYYRSNEWSGIYGIREADQESWSTRPE